MLYDPIPRNVGVIQCTINRNKSGFNKFWPKYAMHLSDGNKFLLSAKKRAANKTSNYLISTDPEDLNKNSASYLGKLRSNFLGTEFYIYNEGSAARKANNEYEIREQHGCI
jgi:tubby-related protein 1